MIEQIISILWMFLTIYLLGNSLKSLLKINKKTSSVFEEIISCYAYGFVAFIILSYILNMFNLIYWWIYLLLGIIVPIIELLKKNDKKINIFTKKEIIPLIVIIFAILISVLLIKGAFVYPWLENDDAWDHAAAAYQIGENHNSKKTAEQLETFGRLYMDPYPPAYPFLMAGAYQLSDNIYWTLKFFNSLLIMFAILFTYIFSASFFKSKITGMISALTIGVLPSFMTHFIWSQTLAIITLIAGLYFLSEYEKKINWLIIASLSFGALILTQQSTAIIGYIMYAIYTLVLFVFAIKKGNIIITPFKKYSFIIYSLIIGILIAMALFYVPMMAKYGVGGTLEGMGFSTSLIDKSQGDDTSGGVIYSFKDITNAPLGSKIDQQTGIGEVVSYTVLLTILFLIFNFKKSKQKAELIIVLAWLIFCFIGLQSNALPIRLFPHRFWVFLSIPIALIFAKGLNIIINSIKNKSVLTLILLLFVIGVGFTSAYPKYVVQNAVWPPGGNFNSNDMTMGYVVMKDTLPKSNVLSFCSRAETVIGMNMKSPVLDMGIENFKKNAVNSRPEEIYSFLKNKNFEYVVIDSACTTYYGQNETGEFIKKFQQGNYELIYNNAAFILLKVN